MSETKLREIHPDILLADGLDSAFLGIVERHDIKAVAVYSVRRIVEKLMSDGMTDEEAWEWFEFNIEGAYVGDRTPLYLHDL